MNTDRDNNKLSPLEVNTLSKEEVKSEVRVQKNLLKKKKKVVRKKHKKQ